MQGSEAIAKLLAAVMLLHCTAVYKCNRAMFTTPLYSHSAIQFSFYHSMIVRGDTLPKEANVVGSIAACGVVWWK
jgi:hypothetical protein